MTLQGKNDYMCWVFAIVFIKIKVVYLTLTSESWKLTQMSFYPLTKLPYDVAFCQYFNDCWDFGNSVVNVPDNISKEHLLPVDIRVSYK